MDAPANDRSPAAPDYRLGYALLGLIALGLLLGLGSFGIWDPTEIELAEIENMADDRKLCIHVGSYEDVGRKYFHC